MQNRMLMQIALTAVINISNTLYVLSQETDTCKTKIFYLGTEYLCGHLVPNHSNFPESVNSSSYALDIGWLNNSHDRSWASFYNYPFTGVTLSCSFLGNDQVFGSQYSFMPYIIFNTSNRLRNSIYFKLGLGGSYFTKHYNVLENPTNKEIGSKYSWSFQSFIYYSLYFSRYLSINIGAGYLHSSNGHTQLPNIGLNQAAISISTQFFPAGINPSFQPKSSRLPVNRTKKYYTMARSGLGFHEYGNAGGPIGGPKRMVKSVTLSVGALFREQIKVDIGFAGRFYEQYYYHILNPIDSAYNNRPKLNASNLYFFIGCEFLAGHIGMDIEGGLNLYKPYFRKHYLTMEGDIDFDFWLKQLFNSKLGLNYYIINTQKKPKVNFFVGLNINANFGQADFSEICIGVTHTFN